MRKGTYAYLDGIPDRTSDLYNDGGFLNEAEVQAEIGNYLDIDEATAGQVLTMGESGFPEWDDVASGGITYSKTEFDTGKKWIDGKTIYGRVIEVNSSSSNIELISLYQNVTMIGGNGVITVGANNATTLPYVDLMNSKTVTINQGSDHSVFLWNGTNQSVSGFVYVEYFKNV